MHFSGSSTFSLFILLGAIAFSVPIRRLAQLVTNDGVFERALVLGGITDATAFAAQVANSLSADPRICAPVNEVFQAIVAGESDTSGVNTIGDRAIVGAKKLFGQQDNGDQGVVVSLKDLTSGNYSSNIRTALQQAFSNPPLTLASLTTYKYLVDTQSALLNLSSTVSRIGGNSSIASNIGQIEPALIQVEAIIDQIGADFSVQNVLNQGNDIQQILSLLGSSATNVTDLAGLNKAQISEITAATQTAVTAMQNLASSAQQASNLSTSQPVVPPSIFTDSPPPGTACS